MRERHLHPDTSLTLVALAALCWGLSGGIAGLLIADGWDPFVLAFYRGAIGLLFVLCWLALHRHDNGLTDRRLWFWSVIAGFGVAGNFAFYFVSITNASVAAAATLMYCAPIYVYLVSFALSLERLTPWKWVAIALVMAGIVLLTGIYDIGSSGITPIGVAAGLLSGLCYAAFIFGFSRAAVYGSPQAVLLIAFTVLITTLFWPGDHHQMTPALRTPQWPLFVILGVLGAGVSFFLYVIGMRRAIPTRAAIVAMIDPIVASLFAVMMLDETLGGLQLAGMVLILCTVTALSVHSNR